MTTPTIPYFVSPFPPLPPTPPIKINGTNFMPSSVESTLPKSSYLNQQQSQSQLLSHSTNHSIPLPFLTFSNQLELTTINEVGLKLFGLDTRIGTNLACFLTEMKEGYNEESTSSEDLKEKLRGQMFKFAKHTKESSTRHWDEGLPIHYFITSGSNKTCFQAEVIVQSLTSTTQIDDTLAAVQLNNTPPDSNGREDSREASPYQGYSILFVRGLSAAERRSRPSKHSRSSSPALSLDRPTLSASNSLRPLSPCTNQENQIPAISRAHLHSHRNSFDSSIASEKDDGEIQDSTLEIVVDDLPGEEKGKLAQYFTGKLTETTPELCKDIVDNLPIICWVTNTEGVALYFSQMWYDFTGTQRNNTIEPEEFIHFFHSDDMTSSISNWQSCQYTGQTFEHEYRVKRYDGKWKWMFVRANCIRNSFGTITGWISSLAELSELIDSRNEAIDSRNEALQVQKFISAVLLGSDIVLLSVDRSLLVTLFEGSPTAAVAVGISSVYPDSSCVGKSLSEVWPDERLGLAVKKILSEDMDAADWLIETEAEQEGGMVLNKHCYRYRLVPLRALVGEIPAVAGVIIVVADVTQLKTAEKDLEVSLIAQRDSMASEVAANEANRLKTEFVTNISHEIRTPIAAMIGICEILLDDSSLQEGHRKLVAKSLRSGEILLDIVGMVLDMGKLVEAGKLHIEKLPFLLSDALDDAALFCMMANKKALEFIESIGPHYGGIFLGDRVRLTQCFSNALSNAIKFTKHGSIKFEVQQESESQTHCVFVFNIRDTGIGIEKDILPTLFVPFQQADTSTAREFGGTGLGLAITRNLVELMGGTIDLVSEFGVGTTVSIRVSLEKAPLIELARVRTTSADLPLIELLAPENIIYESWEGTRILLAEDNLLVQELCKTVLERKKFTVTTVADGLAAVKAVEEDDFDLILLDGQMPRMDGYEAAASIRQLSDPKKRNIKIIALTASAFKGDKERCLDAGMDDYLSKPVRPKVLEAMIWEHTRGNSSKAKWKY